MILRPVLPAGNKTIGKNFKMDIFKAENTIQQDGMKLIVKYSVRAVMCLNMVNNMFLVID